MGSGGWVPTEGPAQVADASGFRPGAQPRYELRPLSLGEILDRAFAVYRGNFWLFAGIAALSGTVQLVANSIQLLVYRGVRIPTHPLGVTGALSRQIGPTISALAFFLAAAVTQAATVWALSEVYLGRPATIESSIRAVIGRWLRFVGIGLWQAWSLMWVPLVLIVPGFLLMVPGVLWHVPWLGGVLLFLGMTGGFAYGVIAFLRNSLAVQAAVVEQLKVRAAIRRSKVLTQGTKGRIFVVFLIAWCLAMVGGVLEMPLAFVIGLGAIRGQQHVLAQAGLLLINFVTHTLVTPVALIGLSLVYFDQRVRQEALDLLLMLGGAAGVGPGREGEGIVAPTVAGEPGPANETAF